MTQFENRSLRCEEYSPPRRGGEDATSIKCCEASFLRSGRGGQTGESKYCAELTTFTASRYRARASRPSARAKGRFAAS